MNVKEKQRKENKYPGKNTNCQASLNFRLEHESSKPGNDSKKDFPLWLKICFDHNHSLTRADFLKFKTVSLETKAQYTDMFESGFSPSGAHAEMKRRIRSEYLDDWHMRFSDRSVLPSIFWVYYYHRKYLDSEIGTRDGVDVFVKASELISEFNTKCLEDHPLPNGECYAKIAQTASGQTVAVICDPFMRRVHQTIPQSSEIVFIDATSNIDRNDTKLIHLMCPSMVGGLPLAEILSTREDEETLHFAFELLKSVLPVGAFHGRGRDLGPCLFMSDDCDALRNALSQSWPCALLLLCQFHVLQALWAYLWDAKHSIAKDDRPTFLRIFRDVLYSKTETELTEHLENLNSNPVCLKYPTYQDHMVSDIFPKMSAWCLEYRVTNKLPTGNNNTNNICESSFRYTKETQLNRHKAYNLCELLSLLLDNSVFYQDKCVDCGNNVLEAWLRNCRSKYVAKRTPNIDPELIVKVGPSSYLVPSETQPDVTYLVDMDIRHCSCPAGVLLGPCKHKQIVSVSQNVQSFDVLPTTNPHMRQLFMELGTGIKIPLDYFLPMQAPDLYPVEDEVSITGTPVPVLTPDATDLHTAPTPVALPGSLGVIDTAEVTDRLGSTLKALYDKLAARIPEDPAGYQRAVSDLEKTVQKLPKTSDSALQKCLHTFGKSVTQVNFGYLKYISKN